MIDWLIDWLIDNDVSHSFTGHVHAYFNPQIERAISAFTSQPRNITTLWIFVLISTYCMVNIIRYMLSIILDADACSGSPAELTADSGTIQSPGYAKSEYPDNARCQWRITAPSGKVRMPCKMLWFDRVVGLLAVPCSARCENFWSIQKLWKNHFKQ